MVDNLPPVEQYTRFFKRPWIQFQSDWHDRQTHHSQMPNYHRDVYYAVGHGLLILATDYPNREGLLLAMVQNGIDQFYSSQLYYRPSTLHKGPMLLAGMFLGESLFFTPGQTVRSDWMTYYPPGSSTVPSNCVGAWNPPAVSPTPPATRECSVIEDDRGWTGATVLWRQDPGDNEHEHVHPLDWVKVTPSSHYGANRESYRRLNSPPYVANCLAMSMMGLKDTWSHDALFDYCDRWMNEYDPDNLEYMKQILVLNLGTDYNHIYWNSGQTGGSSFVDNMYHEYRDLVE